MAIQDYLLQSILSFRTCVRPKFLSDRVAGVTVELVALPVAMAFAITLGVPPQSGLYRAILAGFLNSAPGACTRQIGETTGAFVVVVFGIARRRR